MAKNTAEQIEEVEEDVYEEAPVCENTKSEYHDEIIALVAIAAAILLVLSNFNMSGKVGAFVNGVLFGIFALIVLLLLPPAQDNNGRNNY